MVERFEEEETEIDPQEVVEVDHEELLRIRRENPSHLAGIYADRVLAKRKKWLAEQRKKDMEEVEILLKKKKRIFLIKNKICTTCKTNEVLDELNSCGVCRKRRKIYQKNTQGKKGTLVYRCDICNQGKGVVWGSKKEAKQNKCLHAVRLQRQFEVNNNIWWVDENQK